MHLIVLSFSLKLCSATIDLKHAQDQNAEYITINCINPSCYSPSISEVPFNNCGNCNQSLRQLFMSFNLVNNPFAGHKLLCTHRLTIGNENSGWLWQWGYLKLSALAAKAAVRSLSKYLVHNCLNYNINPPPHNKPLKTRIMIWNILIDDTLNTCKTLYLSLDSLR